MPGSAWRLPGAFASRHAVAESTAAARRRRWTVRLQNV